MRLVHVADLVPRNDLDALDLCRAPGGLVFSENNRSINISLSRLRIVWSVVIREDIRGRKCEVQQNLGDETKEGHYILLLYQW